MSDSDAELNEAAAADQNIADLRQRASQASMPEWDSAIARRSASFSQVVASYYGRTLMNASIISRMVNERYFPKLLDAFEGAYGGVCMSYYCSSIVAAGVLTDQGKIFCICGGATSEGAPYKELIFRCDAIATSANSVLNGTEDGRVLMEMLFNLIHQAMNELEDVIETGTPQPEGLNLLNAEYRRVERFYERAAQRQAQTHYCRGMLLGLLTLVVTVVVVSAIFRITNIGGLDAEPFLGSIIAGGSGAIISVMSRISFKRLKLDHEASNGQITLLGFARPFIGAVFGVVLYMLIAGGILPVQSPEPHEELYFFAGLAFIAGFSERFAQDMLVVAESRTRGTLSQPNSTADEALGPLKNTETVHPPAI